jgi:hypothetical protein
MQDCNEIVLKAKETDIPFRGIFITVNSKELYLTFLRKENYDSRVQLSENKLFISKG